MKYIAIAPAFTTATTVGAQKFPDHSIQMVVPFGPGGITDIMARLLQDELAKALGEGGSIATQYQLCPLIALSDVPVAGYEQVPTARSLGIAMRGSVWGGLVAPKPPKTRSFGAVANSSEPSLWLSTRNSSKS